MELNFSPQQARFMLEKFYQGPITIAGVSCPTDCGDGSAHVRFDIIDLKNNKLIKVNDYFDSESHGYEEEKDEIEDEFGTMVSFYEEASNRLYGSKDERPTSVSVDVLLNIIINHNLTEGK